MYKFFIFLFLIVVAAGAYFVYSKNFTLRPVITPVSTSGWLTYEGGTWTIKYPPSLTPINKALDNPNSPALISFEGLENRDFIGVHFGSLTTDDIGKIVLQRNPDRTDVLGMLLKIQKEQAGKGITILSRQKIQLNNLTAAQFIYTDTSEPQHPSYTISTTFNKNDELSVITYTTDSIQPNPETQQIYNAMLLSFSFKQSVETSDTSLGTYVAPATSALPGLTFSYPSALGEVSVKVPSSLFLRLSFQSMPGLSIIFLEDSLGTGQTFQQWVKSNYGYSSGSPHNPDSIGDTSVASFTSIAGHEALKVIGYDGNSNQSLYLLNLGNGSVLVVGIQGAPLGDSTRDQIVQSITFK